MQIQSNGLSALQRLNAQLASVEASVARLEDGQTQGMQRNGDSMRQALRENQTSLQVQ